MAGALRSRNAFLFCALLSLIVLEQASATGIVVDWTGPSAKTGTDKYDATCDAEGRLTKVNYPIAVTFDDVPETDSLKCGPPVGSLFSLGRTTIACGASSPLSPVASQANFTITLTDTTPPAITIVKPLITINAVARTTLVAYADNAVATDACDPSPSLDCLPSSPSALPVGDTTISCTSTDASNNTVKTPSTYIIRIVDVTPPVLPTDLNSSLVINLEAEGPNGTPPPPGLASYVAADNVDGNIPVTCDLPASTAFLPVGSDTLVTCSAKDAAGNTATGTITIKVRDTIAPVLILPADQVIEATGQDGEVIDLRSVIKATDAVDTAVIITCVPAQDPPTFAYPFGQTTTVTCTATDHSGNKSPPGTFTVKVQDQTPPHMPPPTTPYLEIPLNDTTTGTLPAFPPATDSVWGNIPLVCTPPVGTAIPFNVVTNVVCTATDGSGNKASETYPVKVIRPPSVLTLTVPADATYSADAPGEKVVSYIVSATDSLSNPTLRITCIDANTTTPLFSVLAPSSTQTTKFVLGTTFISCTVINRVGSTDTKIFSITVKDDTKPVIVPNNVVVEATGPLTPVDFIAKALIALSDDISAESVLKTNLVCTGAPGGVLTGVAPFPVGVVTISCTTKDAAGNAADPAPYTVTVQDTTPPTCPALSVQPIYSIINPAAGQNLTDAIKPICTDIVDGTTLTYTCNPTLPANFLPREAPYTISCVVTDHSSNPTTISATFTVVDDSIPFVTVPDSVVVEASSAAGATYSWNASAKTVTEIPLPVTCTVADGGSSQTAASPATFSGLFGPQLKVPFTVVCNTTGPNGHTASATFTVTVVDTTPPVVEQLSSIVITADANGNATYNVIVPKATDAVDPNANITCSVPFGPNDLSLTETGGNNTLRISCVATDFSGNTSPAMTYTVTVIKGAPPQLQCPSNFEVTISACSSYVNASYLVKSSSSSDVVVCTPPSPAKVRYGAPAIVTCTSTNKFGDKATCTFTITASDKIPPVVYVPCNIKAEAMHLGGNYYRDMLKSTAFDNVDGPLTPNCTWPNKATSFVPSYEGGKWLFPVGVTTITCVATDKAGNTGSNWFTVTVTDTRPPVITPNICPQTICAKTSAGYNITLSPTANDLAWGPTPVQGGGFRTLPLGSNKVTFTATDKSGNTASLTVKLTVADCTPPTAKPPTPPPNCGGIFYYDSPSRSGINVPALPQCTGKDNITPVSALKWTYSKANGSYFPPGPTTVVCTVADEAGNIAQAAYTVFIRTAVQHCENAYQHAQRTLPCSGVADKVGHLYHAIQHETPDRCTLCNDLRAHLKKPEVQSACSKTPDAYARFSVEWVKLQTVLSCPLTSVSRKMV